MNKILEKIKQSAVLKALLGVGILVLILGGAFFYLKRVNRVSIDDSQIEAPIITLAPTTPGQITGVSVNPGDSVQKGDQVATVGDESLRSQTDGLIISTDEQIGSLATSQTPVVQMIDPSKMVVVGTLDENKGLDRIKVGQAASFSVDALPGQTFWGYVTEVSPTAKQTQAVFSISSERPTQQFGVSVSFPAEKYPQIKNGMSAKLTIFTNTP